MIIDFVFPFFVPKLQQIATLLGAVDEKQFASDMVILCDLACGLGFMISEFLRLVFLIVRRLFCFVRRPRRQEG